ncbi:uncharacterized protein DFL_009916 [Arthrobotrys flagrans]|uniref:Uncharacterized protein n=1 Tax=Arthrobotrys flagrans TaxID=97331 RepID=A0A436ZTL4_ARTFL|nr:hypothetical protein DFL_009916 [Arthrobotrys flagrans]
MKEADKDISEIVAELKDFQGLLNQVHAALPKDDRAENAELKGVCTALETSNSPIEDISENLPPLMKNGLKSPLKWPFEGEIIQEKSETSKAKGHVPVILFRPAVRTPQPAIQ